MSVTDLCALVQACVRDTVMLSFLILRAGYGVIHTPEYMQLRNYSIQKTNRCGYLQTVIAFLFDMN